MEVKYTQQQKEAWRNAYVTGERSLRDISRDGIKLSYLHRISFREGWGRLRQEYKMSRQEIMIHGLSLEKMAEAMAPGLVNGITQNITKNAREYRSLGSSLLASAVKFSVDCRDDKLSATERAKLAEAACRLAEAARECCGIPETARATPRPPPKPVTDIPEAIPLE